MPTYDYRCLACNHEFEAFQRMSDAPLSECPRCKGEVKRLVGGGAGFLFKGSGFYTTDYRSSDYKSRAKTDSGKTDSGKSDSGKSDSGKSDSGKSDSKASNGSSDAKSSKKEKAAES